MENGKEFDFAESAIDLKRKGITHISPWKDKEELEHVFQLIFGSKSDVVTKQNAFDMMNVWKIRRGNETPASILCTMAVLEVQMYDEKSQKELRQNVNELRSMYSGAFTKFINYITDSPASKNTKKGTMREKASNIGVESFIVDLRNLCSHSAITISIDVLRRSADYCMKWLESCFWKRELKMIQTVEARDVKLSAFEMKFKEELEYILKIYDIATKAKHLGARDVASSNQHLNSHQMQLLRDHAVANSVDSLSTLVYKIVNYLGESIKVLKSGEDIPLLCDAILQCHYMMECPAKGSTERFAEQHQQLIQTLVAKGYIQVFFEKLLQICEDNKEPSDRRVGAKFWAMQIAQGFRNLKKFKHLFKEKAGSRFKQRQHTKLITKNVKKVYFDAMRVDARHSILIGSSADCPWHLSLTKAFVMERIKNINVYTKDVVTTILSLVEPRLKAPQRKFLLSIIDKYVMGVIKDEGITKIPKETAKIYTLEDIVAKMRETNNEEPEKFGIWTKVTDKMDWEKCPLGKIVWE